METTVPRTKSDLTTAMLSVLKNISSRKQRRVTWGSQSIIYFEQSPVHFVQTQIPATTKTEKRSLDQVFDLREVFGEEDTPKDSIVVRKRKKSCVSQDLNLLLGGQTKEELCNMRDGAKPKNEWLLPTDSDTMGINQGRNSFTENSVLPSTEASMHQDHLNQGTFKQIDDLTTCTDWATICEEDESRSVEISFNKPTESEALSPTLISPPLSRSPAAKHHEIARSLSPAQKLKMSSDRLSVHREAFPALQPLHFALNSIEEKQNTIDNLIPTSTFNHSSGQRSQGLSGIVSVTE